MGQIKGQKQYEKFINGERLTFKGAALALCYQCNGLEESNTDCLGFSCPLYQYHPHRTAESLRMQKSGTLSRLKEDYTMMKSRNKK